MPSPPAAPPPRALVQVAPPSQAAYSDDLNRAREAARRGDRRGALAILRPWIEAGRREALLASATYLAWGGHYGEGLARLEGWLNAHPEDGEAALERAQILAWSGRWTAARRAYGSLAAQAPTRDAALTGLARLDLWNQDAEGGSAELSRLSEPGKQDPETRLLAAQLQAASGHPSEAREQVAALAALPGMAEDAGLVLRGLDDRLGPWVEAGFARTDTSEGLRTEEPRLQARLPVAGAIFDLGWTDRQLRLGATAASPSEADLGVTVPAGSRWRFSAGLQHIQEVRGGSTGFAFQASFQAAPGLALGYGHERSFTLATPAAVSLGTAITTDRADLHWQITGRQDIVVAADHGSLSAGSTRSGYTAAYGFTVPHGGFQWRWGLLSRGFSYSETLPLGFFNPRSYRWNGLTGGGSWSGDPRIALSLDAQAGNQTLDGGAAAFSWNWSARAAWTPRGGRATLSAAWSQTRAGLPVVATGNPSDYREHTLAFALRIRGGHGRLDP